jgi:hypothetical protein
MDYEHVFHNGMHEHVKLNGSGPGKGYLKSNTEAVVGVISIIQSTMFMSTIP